MSTAIVITKPAFLRPSNAAPAAFAPAAPAAAGIGRG